VFLLANHGLPWRWVRWRYFGGVLEKLGEACWRSLEKLGVEVKGSFWWKEKERKKIGKENKKGRYFGGLLEKLGMQGKRKLVEEAKGNLECKEKETWRRRKWKVLEYGGSLVKKL